MSSPAEPASPNLEHRESTRDAARRDGREDGISVRVIMLNIRRVDHKASHAHCWRVTVQRCTRVYGRNVSDNRQGGSEKALLATQVYRDQLVHIYPPLAIPVYCAILKNNNGSGVLAPGGSGGGLSGKRQ